MDFDSIWIFLCVVECGSFIVVFVEFDMLFSCVSCKVKYFEDDFGV